MKFLDANNVQIQNTKTGATKTVPFNDLGQYGFNPQESNFQRNMYMFGNGKPNWLQDTVELLPAAFGVGGQIGGSFLGRLIGGKVGSVVGGGVGSGMGTGAGQAVRDELQPVVGTTPQSSTGGAVKGFMDAVKSNRPFSEWYKDMQKGAASVSPTAPGQKSEELKQQGASAASGAITTAAFEAGSSILGKIFNSSALRSTASDMYDQIIKSTQGTEPIPTGTFESEVRQFALKQLGNTKKVIESLDSFFNSTLPDGYYTKSADGIETISQEKLIRLRGNIHNNPNGFGLTDQEAQALQQGISKFAHSLGNNALNSADQAYHLAASGSELGSKTLPYMMQPKNLMGYGLRYMLFHTLMRMF